MRPVPFFSDNFPRTRRPDYSRHRGDIRTRVAIVGGGLTGCACAAAFAAAGIKVVLLEADRIGGGATAGSAGLLRQDLDASFHASVAAHGVRTARHVWQGFRRASLDFSAALRRLNIRADLAPQDLLFFTREGPESARQLQREYKARRDAGLDGSWLTGRAVALDAGITANAGIRTRGEALDPYRACIGLAAAAASKRAQIHERTTVRRVRAGAKSVEITTDGGVITADAVIMATGGLLDDVRALRRHFAPTQSYAVVTESLPPAVRREVGKRDAFDAVGRTRDMHHGDAVEIERLQRLLEGGAVLHHHQRRLDQAEQVFQLGVILAHQRIGRRNRSGRNPRLHHRHRHQRMLDRIARQDRDRAPFRQF